MHRCIFDCTLPSSRFEILASFQLDIQKLFTLNWTCKQNVTTFSELIIHNRSQWKWIFGIIWKCFVYRLYIQWIYICQNESNIYAMHHEYSTYNGTFNVRFLCVKGMFAISKLKANNFEWRIINWSKSRVQWLNNILRIHSRNENRIFKNALIQFWVLLIWKCHG